MSPPQKPIHQEGVLVHIADLDCAITSKNGTSKSESSVKVRQIVVLQDAVEHEDILCSANKQPISQVVSLKEVGESVEKPFEETNDHLQNVDLQLVSLPDSTQTDCLDSSTSCNSSNDGLTGNKQPSLDKVELQRSNSYTKLNRKRRKTRNSCNKAGKKRRTSDVRQNGSRKATGGGRQTNQTCAARNGVSGASSAPPKTGLAGAGFGNQGCQGGGGGGDGGDDGDGPGQNRKIILHDSTAPKAGILKKKKSTTDEMDIDDDLPSSSDSPMDVDTTTRSSEKQSNDCHMGDKSPQATTPEEKLPRQEYPVLTEEFLMKCHLRLNHHTFCKKDDCQRCRWVCDLLRFHPDESKRGCICRNCYLRTKILQFHHPKCKIPGCCVCEKSKQTHVPAVQNQSAKQNVGLAVLNIATAVTSLDTDEAVIYCDDGLQELHFFREHEDFTFKKTKKVGRGGNGEVHDVSLDPKFKNKHLPFANDKFVVKKAIVKEDELKVLKQISNHPNFVKTYLVANRIDGKFKQVILMEKCDKSLAAYLKELHKTGKALHLYEAMHFWTQVLDALVHLHNQRIPIVHKDIKADNVLLTFGTNLIRAKLADFDAVKLLHNEFTQPGLQPKGTLDFIAPEVWRMEVHGRPADIYSMGIFLLELLFGDKIKQPPNVRCYDPTPSPLILAALEQLREMDHDLAELIEYCLKENDKDRPTAVQIRESKVVKKYLEKNIL